MRIKPWTLTRGGRLAGRGSVAGDGPLHGEGRRSGGLARFAPNDGAWRVHAGRRSGKPMVGRTYGNRLDHFGMAVLLVRSLCVGENVHVGTDRRRGLGTTQRKASWAEGVTATVRWRCRRRSGGWRRLWTPRRKAAHDTQEWPPRPRSRGLVMSYPMDRMVRRQRKPPSGSGVRERSRCGC